MADDDPLAAFTAALDAALIDAPEVGTVQLETSEGLEILFYGSEADGYASGGTAFIPAAVLDN